MRRAPVGGPAGECRAARSVGPVVAWAGHVFGVQVGDSACHPPGLDRVAPERPGGGSGAARAGPGSAWWLSPVRFGHTVCRACYRGDTMADLSDGALEPAELLATTSKR
jgi:hypothetical protein